MVLLALFSIRRAGNITVLDRALMTASRIMGLYKPSGFLLYICQKHYHRVVLSLRGLSHGFVVLRRLVRPPTQQQAHHVSVPAARTMPRWQYLCTLRQEVLPGVRGLVKGVMDGEWWPELSSLQVRFRAS